MHRGFRHPEAQPDADKSGGCRDDEDIAPCILDARETCRPGRKRNDNRADRPEAFQHHEPAATVPRGQEFRHHRVIDRQGSTHCHTRHEAQGKQNAEIWRKCRKQPEHGIAGDGNQKHAATTVFVRQPAECGSTDQHAEEKQRAGLQGLRDGEPECPRDGCAGKADRQHLHGVGGPDQTEHAQKTALKCARTCLIERLFNGNFHAAMCPLLPAEDMLPFTALTAGCCQSPFSDIARSFACKYSQKLSAWAGSAAS